MQIITDVCPSIAAYTGMATFSLVQLYMISTAESRILLRYQPGLLTLRRAPRKYCERKRDLTFVF